MKLPAPSFSQDVVIKEGICHVIFKNYEWLSRAVLMENALFFMMCVVELASPCSVFIDGIVLLVTKQSVLLKWLPVGSCNPKAELSNPMLLLHIRTPSDQGVWGLYRKAWLDSRTLILFASFVFLYRLGQNTLSRFTCKGFHLKNMACDKFSSRQWKAIFLSALLNWFLSTRGPPRLYLHIPSCNITSIILCLSGQYMSLVICLWLLSSFTDACCLFPELYPF